MWFMQEGVNSFVSWEKVFYFVLFISFETEVP